ncbi:hypothetical protein [Natronincola ferrireducens]|uniref:Uncharacterized protein n=1 Tax=Natronincola ferrireducens TaxID=393762 RepID=A0A1G9BJH8_9FIRM|nr:hypothetical protein [Natronincola ferrireducens]SDK39678.1 hypothetical protein SAMN05660472_01194 [Natronincola ferrireducens]
MLDIATTNKMLKKIHEIPNYTKLQKVLMEEFSVGGIDKYELVKIFKNYGL